MVSDIFCLIQNPDILPQEITGCTCSTGFGPNRLIARLATKKAKPDGQFYVRSEESKDFIQDVIVSELPGEINLCDHNGIPGECVIPSFEVITKGINE